MRAHCTCIARALPTMSPRPGLHCRIMSHPSCFLACSTSAARPMTNMPTIAPRNTVAKVRSSAWIAHWATSAIDSWIPGSSPLRLLTATRLEKTLSEHAGRLLAKSIAKVSCVKDHESDLHKSNFYTQSETLCVLEKQFKLSRKGLLSGCRRWLNRKPAEVVHPFVPGSLRICTAIDAEVKLY